jgi:hypothetical protein
MNYDRQGISQDTVDRVCQAILDTTVPDDHDDLDERIAFELGISVCAVARARTVIERRGR